MYIAGRFRIACRPSRTWICVASEAVSSTIYFVTSQSVFRCPLAAHPEGRSKYTEGVYKRSEASFYGENRPLRPGFLPGLQFKYCSTVVFTPIFSIRRTSDGRVEIRPRRGLFPLPPNPIVGILEDHADRRERVANSVRGREVLPLAGVPPRPCASSPEAARTIALPRRGAPARSRWVRGTGG